MRVAISGSPYDIQDGFWFKVLDSCPSENRLQLRIEAFGIGEDTRDRVAHDAGE